MELCANGLVSGIFRLMAQVMSPAALEFDMVVNLVDHLLELSGIDSVGAHGLLLFFNVRNASARVRCLHERRGGSACAAPFVCKFAPCCSLNLLLIYGSSALW
ncbi:MAG: hypothetical protein ACLT98_04900 [Eggerthellaceae bacterium]